jgi:hypothetical protein
MDIFRGLAEKTTSNACEVAEPWAKIRTRDLPSTNENNWPQI